MHPLTARRMWTLLEPIHAVVYFAPERRLYADVGLKGGWMGYFASRAAAMGPVPAEVVMATFYNFHPDMVRRAIPDAWRFSTPDAVLAARRQVADAAVRRLLGPAWERPEVSEAADLALEAVRLANPGGRPLFAAHQSLSPPDAPHLRLWHAATCLREHRGDGHVLSLLVEGVEGCEAHVLMALQGAVDAATQRSARGWSEEDWATAEERLRRRRLVTAEGELTEGGHALRAEIEDRTDALAAAPYEALGDERTARLEEALRAVADDFASDAQIPYPNPIGLPPLERSETPPG